MGTDRRRSWAERHQPSSWPPLFAVLKSEAKRGTILPFVIELDGRYVGQLTVGNIQRGAVRTAWIGYWVDEAHSGKGIATAAVALGVDHCFGPVGLHRLDATVQPANEASQKVLKHIGFRQEGLLVRYMDVNKRWRDHLLFAPRGGGRGVGGRGARPVGPGDVRVARAADAKVRSRFVCRDSRIGSPT